ncbi:MAG: tRNA 2-thiouridine(34) synthase MnmA [Clostridia bacterium]|nr:tRNA 2-thiouridine(34) synthase MnmA [Clostridia bacterium]
MKKRVLVGMSGGVDSSAAAAILQKQGYEVLGITFLLSPTGSDNAAKDAAKVCKELSIKHEVIDFSEAFKQDVMDYFADEYKNGRTPNPCVVCNKKIKFGRFLELAEAKSADFIATGHYARIVKDDVSDKYHLYTSSDKAKDQSYFLYNITQKQLAHTLFPLDNITKSETRALAQELNLSVAHRSDSQDICFIPDGDYMRFLKEYAGFKDQKGLFRSTSGEILGEHNGIAHFTIGQRKGLGVTFGKPMFVTGLDAKTNTVYLGEKGTEFSEEFTADNLHLIDSDELTSPVELLCKIRYAAPLALCTVTPLENGRVHIKMHNPARAVTPGQSVVFYLRERVIGGAVIENIY